MYPDVFRNSTDEITTLIIGEAPGAQEDKQGKPFVGSSGKILRKELARIPGQVVITNTVKCRPPENRNPKSDEKNACKEFLDKELDYYNPDIIVLVGRISSSLVLDAKTLKNFTSLSGTLIKEKYISVLHPASTMYNAKKNRPIWEESWINILKIMKDKFPEAKEIKEPIQSKNKSNKNIASLDQFMQEDLK